MPGVRSDRKHRCPLAALFRWTPGSRRRIRNIFNYLFTIPPVFECFDFIREALTTRYKTNIVTTKKEQDTCISRFGHYFNAMIKCYCIAQTCKKRRGRAWYLLLVHVYHLYFWGFSRNFWRQWKLGRYRLLKITFNMITKYCLDSRNHLPGNRMLLGIV